MAIHNEGTAAHAGAMAHMAQRHTGSARFQDAHPASDGTDVVGRRKAPTYGRGLECAGLAKLFLFPGEINQNGRVVPNTRNSCRHGHRLAGEQMVRGRETVPTSFGLREFAEWNTLDPGMERSLLWRQIVAETYLENHGLVERFPTYQTGRKNVLA